MHFKKGIFASKGIRRVLYFFYISVISCAPTFDSANPDVETANATPVAEAGVDREVVVGSLVQLNGVASSDLEGSSLEYHWEIVKIPPTSSFVLPKADQPSFEFRPDRPGLFIFQLHVNDGELNSAPDQVIVTALNRKPLARPTFFGQAKPGQTVSLDGSQSIDGDGHSLTFHWKIISRPEGSQAIIVDQLSQITELSIDLSGVYVLHLLASDGYESSEPAIIVIPVSDAATPIELPTINLSPVAEAGKDIVLRQPGLIQLDGSASYDPNNEPLTFAWELIARPPSSQAFLSSPVSDRPQLNADIQGDYVAKLTVSDSSGLTHFDTVVVAPKHGGLFCADCHNGNIADKADHPQTVLSYSDCGRCHSTRHWYMGSDQQGSVYSLVMKNAAQRYYHDGVVSGCHSCHGSFPQAVFASHPVTSSRCSACHTKFSWKTRLNLEHTKALGACKDCHSYTNIPSHPTGSMACDYCHQKTDWIERYQPNAHASELDLLCFDCHITTRHYLQPSVHDGTSDLCEKCHSIIDWVSVYINHGEYVNDCVVCHNNETVFGRSESHIASSELCHACHSSNRWAPVLLIDETQKR